MDTLLARIAAGTYRVGSMLPKEERLAAELDVSRGVVRECIRALEERGVVRVRHGRGATVLPARAWDVLDPQVFATVHGAAGGRRLVSEAVEAVAIVQGEAAALAAERSHPEAVRALSAAVDAVETATGDGVAAAELEFGRALADAAGNRPLARVAAELAEAMAAAESPRHGRPEGYRDVLDAIAAADPAVARAAMKALSREARSASGRAASASGRPS
jgi:GntR family transcriptional regulator, galactonate operon transcriptional repressor